MLQDFAEFDTKKTGTVSLDQYIKAMSKLANGKLLHASTGTNDHHAMQPSTSLPHAMQLQHPSPQ